MKKILSFVMVFVMALCLGGCGQDTIPKADYSFSAQDFTRDCLLNHGKDLRDSLVEANKIYKNKRIEINGEIMAKSKERKVQMVLGFRQVKKMNLVLNLVLRVSVRDKNILDKLKEEDFIKMSCLFDRIGFQEEKDETFIYFDFYDGVLISKL